MLHVKHWSAVGSDSLHILMLYFIVFRSKLTLTESLETSLVAVHGCSPAMTYTLLLLGQCSPTFLTPRAAPDIIMQPHQ